MSVLTFHNLLQFNSLIFYLSGSVGTTRDIIPFIHNFGRGLPSGSSSDDL